MLSRRNPQLNANGELIHLLSIEGLPREVLTHILDTAGTFLSVNDREVKKVPLLRGKSVFNLFFENSTRTRTTFEIAAKRLSADVINLDIARSSTAKGESLLDTYTIRHYKRDFTNLAVAVVGDIVHSRVARSDIHALTTLGVPEIRAVG